MSSIAELPAHWQEKITVIGECWNWHNASAPGARYGMIRHEGRMMGAHRAMWQRTNGHIPAGMVVRHNCDNPACVNPAHLLLGTQSDNILDAVERGRHRAWNGEKTQCKRGHELAGENVYVIPRTGARQCRTCAHLRYVSRRATRAA